MLEFKPPKPNQALISICKLLLPVYLAAKDRIAIEICNHDPELIDNLKNKRVVIVANHPDRQDTLAVACLVKYLGETAYTMAAREIFDWEHGLRGWLFQRLGCYSVVRDKQDLQSTQMTMKILLGEPSKLIVFPESDVTG